MVWESKKARGARGGAGPGRGATSLRGFSVRGRWPGVFAAIGRAFADTLARVQVLPLTLTGRAVRVEPLALEHAADIAAVIELESMRYLLDRPAAREAWAVEQYIARQLVDSSRVAFAIVDRPSSRALGSTSYMDIRPSHRGLEIGHTWLAPGVQGTQVNPETKFLLLRHAFETLGCVRVQLKTDGRNVQSQAAMLKLGCTREGVLRRHVILPDGFVRDTVMFSIVDSEWPSVRDRLVQRLGYTP